MQDKPFCKEYMKKVKVNLIVVFAGFAGLVFPRSSAAQYQLQIKAFIYHADTTRNDSYRHIATVGQIASGTMSNSAYRLHSDFSYTTSIHLNKRKTVVAPNSMPGHHSTLTTPMAQAAEMQKTPDTFILSQNYPNPFNPSTVIKYGLPRDAKVKLAVYDLLGRRVALLIETEVPAGYHEVVFENAVLPGGVYFYRLQAGSFMQTKKMLLVR